MRTNKYDDLRLILSELIKENDTATTLGDIEDAIEKSVKSIVKLFDLPSVGNLVLLSKANYKSKDGTIKRGIEIDGKYYAPQNDC